jgi:hypothetical protein
VRSLNVSEIILESFEHAGKALMLTLTGVATWILLWPEDGRMKKEDIRRVYDGSLFYEIAARRPK